MRRALPFPVSCTKAALCAILSAKGGRHHAQTDFFSRTGLCSLAAGRLCRKAADHTGLCADLCRQPARRIPHHAGRAVFCGPCAAADRGQGGHSGQSERRVRLRAASVGAACHWRRRFCPCVALGGHRRSAPAQRAAAAVSLPGCRPYVARAGWQHRGRVFAGLYRTGTGRPELVRRGCPLVLCPSAGAQPERSAGQDHPRAGFADRDRHDPPAGCSAGDHGVQRCVLGA